MGATHPWQSNFRFDRHRPLTAGRSGTKGIEIPILIPNALSSSILSAPQTVIAERTSYSSVAGSVLTDGNDRKVL